MTKGEREDLRRLARQKAKLAKSKADERAKALMAQVEEQLAAEYDPYDEAWAAEYQAARAAIAKLNAEIASNFRAAGLTLQNAPSAQIYWRERGESASAARRAELRRLAAARLDAMTAAAKTAIETSLVDIETELTRDGLESGEALTFLAALPSAENLLPSLTLDDLGRPRPDGWRPPDGAAAALTATPSAADRKRRRIRQAIEDNPGLSDRGIAAIAQCDHTTVAAWRRGGGSSIEGGGSTSQDGGSASGGEA